LLVSWAELKVAALSRRQLPAGYPQPLGSQPNSGGPTLGADEPRGPLAADNAAAAAAAAIVAGCRLLPPRNALDVGRHNRWFHLAT